MEPSSAYVNRDEPELLQRVHVDPYKLGNDEESGEVTPCMDGIGRDSDPQLRHYHSVSLLCRLDQEALNTMS